MSEGELDVAKTLLLVKGIRKGSSAEVEFYYLNSCAVCRPVDGSNVLLVNSSSAVIAHRLDEADNRI